MPWKGHTKQALEDSSEPKPQKEVRTPEASEFHSEHFWCSTKTFEIEHSKANKILQLQKPPLKTTFQKAQGEIYDGNDSKQSGLRLARQQVRVTHRAHLPGPQVMERQVDQSESVLGMSFLGTFSCFGAAWFFECHI